MVYNTRSASKANGYNTRSSTLASKDASSNGKSRKTPNRISNGIRKTKSVTQSKPKRNLKTSNKDGSNKVVSHNTRSSSTTNKSSSTTKKKNARSTANSKKRNTRNSKKSVEKPPQDSAQSLAVPNFEPSPHTPSDSVASPIEVEANVSTQPPKRSNKRSKNPTDHTTNQPTKRTRITATQSTAEEPQKRATRSASHSTNEESQPRVTRSAK
ncbi:6572_t:CDS:1 [Ambispora leptoticha]|uniref:6572_t:CDS:1 n=1 Tax=Ambispora leptoticha TaxID=144679 RepID=A0A9N9FLP0_9GLOM|nr:6572_t:CDS:1 [Ambispora leptoticha]